MRPFTCALSVVLLLSASVPVMAQYAAQPATADDSLLKRLTIPGEFSTRLGDFDALEAEDDSVTTLAPQSDPPLRPTTVTTDDSEGADVLGAFKDSLRLLLIEHGTRVLFQEKTRRELGGNFWVDYHRSVRWPGQWDDTDAWWVNYIGHPIHGAAAGYLWLDHERGDPVAMSLAPKYWSSRARAMAFAATYSIQFEIGPLSEASIGNVGMRPETTGWVDHVITPIGAFGFIVAEDALDRYLVEWAERRITNRVARASLRILFNPGRALANGASGRTPWHRPDRSLAWR